MRLSKALRNSGVVAVIWAAILGITIIFWPGVIPARAQNNSGVIEGLVEDANGGKLPNAVIIAFNNDTGQSMQATTGSDGAFRLPNLLFGKYRVEVSLSGFAKKTINEVTVEPVNAVKLTVVLSPQGVSEIVNITSEGQLLQTENSTQARRCRRKNWSTSRPLHATSPI